MRGQSEPPKPEGPAGPNILPVSLSHASRLRSVRKREAKRPEASQQKNGGRGGGGFFLMVLPLIVRTLFLPIRKSDEEGWIDPINRSDGRV